MPRRWLHLRPCSPPVHTCTSDVDTTGYAVQALAWYRRIPRSSPPPAPSVGAQQTDGGFSGAAGENSNSTGLCAGAAGHGTRCRRSVAGLGPSLGGAGRYRSAGGRQGVPGVATTGNGGFRVGPGSRGPTRGPPPRPYRRWPERSWLAGDPVTPVTPAARASQWFGTVSAPLLLGSRWLVPVRASIRPRTHSPQPARARAGPLLPAPGLIVVGALAMLLGRRARSLAGAGSARWRGPGTGGVLMRRLASCLPCGSVRFGQPVRGRLGCGAPLPLTSAVPRRGSSWRSTSATSAAVSIAPAVPPRPPGTACSIRAAGEPTAPSRTARVSSAGSGIPASTVVPATRPTSLRNTPPASAYWSYWHATPDVNHWSYSKAGATNTSPGPGSVDAWVFGATTCRDQRRTVVQPRLRCAP